MRAKAKKAAKRTAPTRRTKKLVTARTRKRRRNPIGEAEAAAAAMSEAFHGRPAEEMRDYIEDEQARAVLADLGRLVDIGVWIEGDRFVGLKPKGVRLATTPEGGQLYFVGGDQELNLQALELDAHLPKDFINVGEVQTICYHTSKAFHSFEPSPYEHDFGEGEELPTLQYDVLNKRMFLTGGSYQVKPEGITD